MRMDVVVYSLLYEVILVYAIGSSTDRTREFLFFSESAAEMLALKSVARVRSARAFHIRRQIVTLVGIYFSRGRGKSVRVDRISCVWSLILKFQHDFGFFGV